MRRAFLFVVIVFALIVPICASGQTTRGKTQPAKGKLLVDRLPAGVEGVELKGGEVRLKAGFKFVKKGNAVSIARIRGGGPSVSGEWSCNCTNVDGGGCITITAGSAFHCVPATEDGCKTSCLLVVTTDGFRKGIIIY